MLSVVLCYNNGSELLCGAIKNFLNDYPEVEFSSWNEDLFNERQKSFKTKGHFAARMTPFCGIFKDSTGIKGFYSEVNECTESNICTYLKGYIQGQQLLKENKI